MQHSNNLNLLRLLFAIGVVYSHSFASVGLGEPVLWTRSLGNLCVHGFFVISGYLIADSYLRMPRIVPFAVNRALRIVPGLILAILLTKGIAALCDTYMPTQPHIVNGPLWTLSWEVVCYAMVTVFGLVGVLTPSAMPAVFVAAWLAFLVRTGDPSGAYNVVAPMMLVFLTGSFIRVCQDRISISKAFCPMLVLLILCFNGATADPIIHLLAHHIGFSWGPVITPIEIRIIGYLIAFPFVVLYLGLKAPALWTSRTDVSYGVYIFAWPISQAISYLAIQQRYQLSPYLLFTLTMLATVPLAWLSWTFVERKALQFKVRAPSSKTESAGSGIAAG